MLRLGQPVWYGKRWRQGSGRSGELQAGEHPSQAVRRAGGFQGRGAGVTRQCVEVLHVAIMKTAR